jgi:hypothetical protein
MMQQRIHANAQRTAGDAAATEIEELWVVGLIAGGALALFCRAVVPA